MKLSPAPSLPHPTTPAANQPASLCCPVCPSWQEDRGNAWAWRATDAGVGSPPSSRPPGTSTSPTLHAFPPVQNSATHSATLSIVSAPCGRTRAQCLAQAQRSHRLVKEVAVTQVTPMALTSPAEQLSSHVTLPRLLQVSSPGAPDRQHRDTPVPLHAGGPGDTQAWYSAGRHVHSVSTGPGSQASAELGGRVSGGGGEEPHWGGASPQGDGISREPPCQMQTGLLRRMGNVHQEHQALSCWEKGWAEKAHCLWVGSCQGAGWAHRPPGPRPPSTPNTEPPGVYAAGGKGAGARTWLLAPDDNHPLWTCFPSVSQELG